MPQTTLFLDTEFTGLHQQARLISLALVSDTRQAFYAEFTDFDAFLPSETSHLEWLRTHVLDNLLLKEHDAGYLSEKDNTVYVKGDSRQVCQQLKLFIEKFESIEIWGDCPVWDWVLFCELFGGALRIPSSVFYLPFDLVTLLKVKGIDPDVDRASFSWNLLPETIQVLPRHNALRDAWCIWSCYHQLQT